MIALRNSAALILAAISLIVSGFLLLNRPDPEAVSQAIGASQDSADAQAVIEELQANLRGLTEDLDYLKRSVGEVGPGPAGPEGEDPGNVDESGEGPPAFASIDERLRNLEGSLNRLQSNYDGISIEASSAERAEIFASEEGAIKADEYFEAGKYSIAAEGYLTYYKNHPDDPDSRAILQRARGAYGRAGYSDMAMWVQEEMLRLYPETRSTDLKTLAAMKKTAGDYDAAVAHAAESAELTENPQERLWTRLYWAWYKELRDGASGGLDAYSEVQREIEEAGFSDHRLNERAQEKIEEIQKQIAAGGR